MSSTINMRPLGRTGLKVSEIALGGLFVNEEAGTARDEAVRVVHRALELGINYIDTAPLYGNSQQIMGEALAGRKEPYILGSKCGRWDWQTGPYRDLDAFKRQFEQTLRDLRRDSVDILYIHEADWAAYWEDAPVPRTALQVALEAKYDYERAPVTRFLVWARDQGMVRYFGLSGNRAIYLAKVLGEIGVRIDAVLVAYQYSLIWRDARKHLLPLAKDMGVAAVIGTPLQQGWLAVPHREWIENPPEWMDEDLRERYRNLYAIHDETGLSLAEMALRFLLQDQDFATIIPGAASVAQLEENVRCSSAGPLPRDLHLRLDALGKVFT